MKKLMMIMIPVLVGGLLPNQASAQPGTENFTTVNVQMMKTKMPENGSIIKRDSLIAIYNENVVKKNEFVLSHRELVHWFTANNKDYMIIEEYKDFASMENAFKKFEELEKNAWPDEKKRKEFMDAMGSYFEDWHGDALYRSNPKLSK